MRKPRDLKAQRSRMQNRKMPFLQVCVPASRRTLNFEKEDCRSIEDFVPHGTGSTPQASLLKSLLTQPLCARAVEKKAGDKASRTTGSQLVERKIIATLEKTK